MSIPVFDDVEPLPACGCEECARQRLADAVARGSAGPAATGATRAAVVAAVATTALGGAVVVAAPAGATASVSGTLSAAAAGGTHAALPAAPLRLTRTQILARAETWVRAKVPYSMTAYWKDGYRQDCSGFVSMAWGLDANAWTGDLRDYAVRIGKDALRPGDVLLFHNAADPRLGSHVVLFGGWTDASHTHYTGYEQTRPGTRVRTTPYAYWTNSARYVPYRYKYLAATAAQGPAAGNAYPGAKAFGPGADNAYVTRLGTMLVGRGAARFYASGPGPKWSRADRDATAAFQRAQGWTGADADGLPGPTTWTYLVGHRGKDIPAAPGGAAGKKPAAKKPVATKPAGAKPAGTKPAAAKAGAGRTRAVTPGVTSGVTAAGVTAAGATGADAPQAGAVRAAGPAAAAPAAVAAAAEPARDGGVPAYPGAGVFRPGHGGDAVLALGRRLVAKGFGGHYRTGPGRAWTEADRRNVEAFQRAQGFSGRDADGHPGPETWRRLFA
jgi:hypothetical protein